MKLKPFDTKSRIVIPAIALGVVVIFLAWLGFRATGEWQKSAIKAAERRADEVSALLIAALTRDMQGAQQAILVPLEQDKIILHAPHDLVDTVAHAFSRFPYPESFFVWRSVEPQGVTTALLNRTDRPPPWSKSDDRSKGYPVTLVANSPVAERLVALSQEAVQPQGLFAVYHTTIDDVPYQVLARFYYGDTSGQKALAIVGFTVNLDWAKSAYFSDLLSQVELISGRRAESSAISLTVIDQHGRILSENRPPSGSGPVRERDFPVAFFDSSAIPVDRLQQLPLERWIARINTSGDALLAAANSSASRTRGLIAIATVISIAGIVLGTRFLVSHFQLESMKTEFVARVSHELKTPLASISLVGDTLSKGRYTSSHAITDYGAVLSKEASRLKKLVDNLLTFSKIADSQDIYCMVDADIEELVCEALERLRPQLNERQFDVRFTGSASVATVRCDREAMIQTFENIIENAIRYSDKGHSIEISVNEHARGVDVSFRDGGKGIPPEEIPRVFERFYRGKYAVSAGSGLGLSIARKIVQDHGGRISIESAPGKGTLVGVVLPASRETRSWDTAY